MSLNSAPHIPLDDKLCIFCQQKPRSRERIVTVLDCETSKAYTSAYEMPMASRSPRLHRRSQYVYGNGEAIQWLLCIRPGCIPCTTSPKLILFHADCHSAFRVLWERNGIELPPSSPSALLDFASILSPWLPPVDKPPSHLWWSRSLKKMSVLPAKPTELGSFVSSLSTLPLELLGLILEAGGYGMYHSALLRHVLVAHVAGVVSGQAKQVCMPALDFLDNQYMVSEKDAGVAEPLGVDYLGVRMVSDNSPWYLQTKDVELRYQYPFLRPLLNRQLEMWDVPKLPDDGSYRFHSPDENKSNLKQIRSINFSGLTGLTFLCGSKAIYAIHKHQTHHSSALDTFLSLSPVIKRIVVLLYFPFDIGREIINQIWIRETYPNHTSSRTVMIRTSQRTLNFGPNGHCQESYYFQLTDGPTTSLLYHVPASGQPISVFGAASKSLARYPSPKPPVIPEIGEVANVHRTRVSLKDVAHVEVYTHILQNICSGILVKYDDGREESLGQRRAGLPGVQTILVSKPSQLHYKRFQTEDNNWRLNIIFSTCDSPKTVDAEEGWLSQAMGGEVAWSVSWRSDQLHFFDAE
ncbi:uncharacterized protein BP5553_05847 [Venustampulla echinocandica]|uniref:Uncharacterized protein n=1 Tax=Venustampulla echinocandica TaxID=2656787 RepID=A0A370TLU8_9HELO|nr:uncharacterized protein BP5553_05847 [Venustampulla echinocandica]RDL36495.1 hypothetical protein BP5553_05847 [Venustampulla echinocandica]